MKDNSMTPATEEELQNIRIDFVKFLNLKNSEMKAAYMAATGRGFINIIESKNDMVIMGRDRDNSFVVCSMKIEPIRTMGQMEPRRIIRFHTDKAVFI